MLQTLFHIPRVIGGLPVFGFGWALMGWSIFCAIVFFRLLSKNTFSAAQNLLPTAAVFGLIIAVVLPLLENKETGEGIPIRGYGVMLLIAVVSGVGVAMWRAKRAGVDPEVIMSLAFWMFVAGIVGARSFYVIQKWEKFSDGTLLETLGSIVNVVGGGLVVYGALIGAVGAFLVFCFKYKLPMLLIGDLMAPSMLLGLAIGRVGCLLNGCCYGGVCEKPWAVTFPPEAPPYTEHLETGQLHGFQFSSNAAGDVIVKSVTEGSAAQKAGLTAGDVIRTVNGRTVTPQTTLNPIGAAKAALADRALRKEETNVRLSTADSRVLGWDIGSLPARSRPVHPTQLYSAITGFVLFALVLAYAPFRKRHGQVFALVLTIYPIARFLLERIRIDELGQFGTSFTISQLVSFGIFAVAMGLWLIASRQERLTIA